MKRLTSKEQLRIIVQGMLCIVLLLVLLQLWLFTATLNTYLAGDRSVVWPAAIVSLICFLFNLGLLRYLYKIENNRQ
ncbi:MAG: hypothetical protein JNN15_01470 [Blastocatellia bacterium]|nr:hypothetical protein [Blastocatellia bacterium]